MSNSIHQFTVKTLAGKEIKLEDYKGRPLMIVNTASKCGYTPQLKQLEELYQKYKDKGFMVLAFPSNDFNKQEPLEGEAIQQFCEVNYGVTFPVFDKVHVKGSWAIPLFKFFADKKQNGKFSRAPKWNFYKYLIDKEGRVVDYFYVLTEPMNWRVRRAVEKMLK